MDIDLATYFIRLTEWGNKKGIDDLIFYDNVWLTSRDTYVKFEYRQALRLFYVDDNLVGKQRVSIFFSVCTTVCSNYAVCHVMGVIVVINESA